MLLETARPCTGQSLNPEQILISPLIRQESKKWGKKSALVRRSHERNSCSRGNVGLFSGTELLLETDNVVLLQFYWGFVGNNTDADNEQKKRQMRIVFCFVPQWKLNTFTQLCSIYDQTRIRGSSAVGRARRGSRASRDGRLRARLLLLGQLGLNLTGELVQVLVHAQQAEPPGVEQAAVLSSRQETRSFCNFHWEYLIK